MARQNQPENKKDEEGGESPHRGIVLRGAYEYSSYDEILDFIGGLLSLRNAQTTFFRQHSRSEQ